MLLTEFVLARGNYISPALHFRSHSLGNSKSNNKNKNTTKNNKKIKNSKKEIQIQVKLINKTMLAPQK